MIMNNLNIQIESDLSFYVLDNHQKKMFDYKYEPSYRLSIQTWYGFILPPTIIDIYQAIAKFAFERKQAIHGSITDLREIEGSFDSTNEWLVNEYMPRAVKYGFRVAGIIQAQDFYARLATEDLEEMKSNYKTKHFENFEECYAWITEELGNKTT